MDNRGQYPFYTDRFTTVIPAEAGIQPIKRLLTPFYQISRITRNISSVVTIPINLLPRVTNTR